MRFEQVLQVIDAVSKSEVTDFKYESDGVRLHLKKEKKIIMSVAAETVMQPCSVAAVSPSDTEPEKEPEVLTEPEGKIVTSPPVGTFYAAPSEGREPYVKVGDIVRKGQTLAIVEAMKLMNEIESEFEGVVAEIFVENAQAVEYGQPLFRIQ